MIIFDSMDIPRTPQDQQEFQLGNTGEQKKHLPPRAGPFGDRPGVYSLVTKLFTPIIDKGDLVSFQLFFSGYGEIKIGKVFLTLPAEIFDAGKSKISSDFILDETVKKWWWGANPYGQVTQTIVITQTGGVKLPWWDDTTQFFNPGDEKTIYLSTETVTTKDPGDKRGSGPMNFDLRTLSNIRPGNYSIDTVFTYFNGESWCTSPKRVEFKVQNFLERFATEIGCAAVIGSALAIVIGLLELFDRLNKFF
jgi:hypothetical protein